RMSLRTPPGSPPASCAAEGRKPCAPPSLFCGIYAQAAAESHETLRGAASRGPRSGPLQRALERAEVTLVVPPPSRRARVERLAHLPDAGRLHGVAGLVKSEASLVPCEPAMGEQTLERRARRAHQLVVIEVEDVVAEHGAPVRHQPPVAAVVVGDVLEVERVGHAVIEV